MTILLSHLFIAATIKYGLPANLLSSICYVESKHLVTAIHKDDGGQDSLGICQIHASTARMMGFKGTNKQLMLPQNNIRLAAAYLAHQLKRYHGDVVSAVISYNRGSTKHLLTTSYSVKVIKQWRTYEAKNICR